MESTYWHDQRRVEQLTALWEQGLSALKIANTMGGGVSRNAILGKAHRIGLPGRPCPIKGKRGEGNNYKRKRRENREKRDQLLGVKADIVRPLPKLSRSPGDKCQWLHGQPRQRSFCNAPALEGRSWCPDHYAVVFLPKPQPATSPAT